MFTGIVEGLGEVVRRAVSGTGERFSVRFPPIEGAWTLGQSVAIDGVCLTVTAIAWEGERAVLSFDLAGETLRRTHLGAAQIGRRVNFERGLLLGARLDGHLVQGHVDGTGQVLAMRREAADVWLEAAASTDLLRGVLQQGSITIDGVSLTVARLEEQFFACTLVPHTLQVTNLADRRVGDLLNLETDPIGKWIARLMPGTKP